MMSPEYIYPTIRATGSRARSYAATCMAPRVARGGERSQVELRFAANGLYKD